MKTASLLAAIAGSALCTTAALAQAPTPTVDLGTLSYSTTATGTVDITGGTEIKWIKFTIPAVARISNQWLDIYTTASTLAGNDTHIGLYSNTGAFLAADDDDGAGFLSGLSYGALTPTRPYGTGIAGNGRDGANLAAGTYWLAVGNWLSTFGASNWIVSSNGVDTGTVTYSIDLRRPESPTGLPAPAFTSANANVLLNVVVTPVGAPTPSTGLAVVADLTSIGGGATVSLFDNATNGDPTANDNSFNRTVLVGAVAPGTYILPLAISDAQARSSTGTLTLVVQPAGGVCSSAVDVGPIPASVAFDNSTGTINDGVIAPCSFGGVATSRPLWFKLTNASAETKFYNMDLCAGARDTVLTVHSTCGGAALFCNDDSDNCGAASLASALTLVRVNAGATAFIRTAMWGTTPGGTNTLNIIEAPTSDPSGVITFSPANAQIGQNVTIFTNVTPGGSPASTGLAVTLDLIGIDAGFSVVALDNGVAPDVTLNDGIFTASVVIGPAAVLGSQTVTALITDLEGRVGTATANYSIVGPLPTCPAGAEPQTFTNATADGAPANAGNSVFTFTTAGAGNYNRLNFSGRVNTLADGTFVSEARFRVTTPEGTPYFIQPFPAGSGGAGVTADIAAGFFVTLPAIASASGVWTIETFDSFDDPGLDARWDSFCVAFESVQTNPTATTGTLAGCVRTDTGGTATFTLTTQAGVNPPSTGIGASIGLAGLGLPDLILLDNGVPPDVAINDGIFSGSVVIPGGVAAAAYLLPATVFDAQGRSAVAGNFNLVVIPLPTGVTPATAEIPAGSPGDAIASLDASLLAETPRMFKITICNPGDFSASTAGSTTDTTLALFDANGVGIVLNDDIDGVVFQSTIDSSTLIGLPAGDYYLAVAEFLDRPIGGDICAADGGVIWTGAPFTGQRLPNGTGAAGPVIGWDAAGLGGAVTINLTGTTVPGLVCPPVGPDCQSMADVASDGLDTTYSPNGSVGAEDLDAFIAGFIAENAAIADVASDGLDTTRNPNGSVGSEDLDAFIAAFIACS